MTLKDAGQLALHVAGGAALAVPVLLWPWTCGLVFAVWGLMRERAQHLGEGWPEWLSWHRVAEGCAWGAGAQLAWLVIKLIGG